MSFFSHVLAIIAVPFIAITGLFAHPQAVPITATSSVAVVASTTTVSQSTPTYTGHPINSNTSPSVQTQTTPKIAPAPETNGITCNGTYYTPCGSSAGTPVCLSDGSNAYCRPPQPTQSSQQTPETLAPQVATPPAFLSALANEISQLQTQSTACTNKIGFNSSEDEADGAIAAEVQADECQNLSSELSVFLEEQNVIQEGDFMSVTCSTNIQSLESKIYDLRQAALGKEAGDLTTGIGDTGAELAQQAASVEAAQEAPLNQQVQQNLYYCQS